MDKNGIAAAAIFMAMALAGCQNTDQGSGSSQSVQSESAQDQAGQTENAEKRFCYRSYGAIIRARGRF